MLDLVFISEGMLCSFSRDIHNRYHVHEHTHHVDSALEIQQKAHHTAAYIIFNPILP